MNLNAILQPAVVFAHLLVTVILVAIAVVIPFKRWASALSLIAMATSGIATIGLAAILLAIISTGGGPGIIAPIAFASGLAVALVAYIAVLLIAAASRPRPFQRGLIVSCTAFAGFAAFNTIFLALPSAAGTTITVYVRSPDSTPVAGARLTYKTKFDANTVTITSDSTGRVFIPAKLGDTIDGQFEPMPLLEKASLYMSGPTTERNRWGIQRHWKTSFGSAEFEESGFFLSDLDDPSEHSVVVYLPWRDKPRLLPYKQLTRLADRLKEAQSTGQMFNPEVNVQNLESYVQLAEVAQAYDPKSPVRHYAENIFTYLTFKHDSLNHLLKKITHKEVSPDVRDTALAHLLSLFDIPASPSSTWQEKRDLIQQRLDRDLAIIKNVPKPM